MSLLSIVAGMLAAWIVIVWVRHARERNAAQASMLAALGPPTAVLVESPRVVEHAGPAPARFRWATVAGADAAAAMPALDALGAREGWIPVLVGAHDELPDFALFAAEDARTPEQILAAAEAIDAPSWFAQRGREATAGIEDKDLHGEWINDERQRRGMMRAPYAVCRTTLLERPHPFVHVALVPVREAWQAPAFLGNGGWNDVPDVAEQVAVLRHWHRAHGAVLRAFNRDVMEFDVARPPAGRDASMALAREQFAFCPDLVHQGVGALRPLASALDGSTHWYFWWD